MKSSVRVTPPTRAAVIQTVARRSERKKNVAAIRVNYPRTKSTTRKKKVHEGVIIDASLGRAGEGVPSACVCSFVNVLRMAPYVFTLAMTTTDNRWHAAPQNPQPDPNILSHVTVGALPFS